MTRRTRLADVLVLGLLVGTLNCKPAPEKSADITPSAQDSGDEHVEYTGRLFCPVLEVVGDSGRNPEERAGVGVEVLLTDQKGHRPLDYVEQLFIRLVGVGARTRHARGHPLPPGVCWPGRLKA